MKKRLTILVVMLLVTGVAFAASPWTTEVEYKDKAAQKLVFGAKNLLLGWTELITEPVKAEGGMAIVEGIGRGILNTVVYTVGGALHLVTFPFTEIDVPLPDGGISF